MPKTTPGVPPLEVPRLGPPTNLRPAGAHKDKRRRSRAQEKAALNKAAFDFVVPAALGAPPPPRSG